MAKQAKVSIDYGNWVAKRIIYLFGILGTALLALAFLFWISAIPAVICIIIAAYFAYARYMFSPKGGNVQNQIWDLVLSNLNWTGEGKAIDIGCGNGALTSMLAKRLPSAKVIGIDFWGERWEYSKKASEANADLEGVGDRVEFRKASASKLPYDDEYFDAAISNFCFHEVADTRDKREVIREALRVLKKGGEFAFQDLFQSKQIYGEPSKLVETVKSWGIEEVEYVESRNASFIPTALKLPFMLGRIGIIKGQK